MYIISKLKFGLILSIALLMFMCKENNIEGIKGSWYKVDTISNIYEEIHMNDSLMIYCFNNCEIILPFDIVIDEDSLHMYSLDQLKHSYRFSLKNDPKKQLRLIFDQDTLVFEALDTSYKNLEEVIHNYESLDSITRDYFQRKSDILDSIKNPMTPR